MGIRPSWSSFVRVAGLVSLTLVAACDILDVDDPQSIELDELDTGLGAEALLNGAELTASIAAGRVAAIHGIAADEPRFSSTRSGLRGRVFGLNKTSSPCG